MPYPSIPIHTHGVPSLVGASDEEFSLADVIEHHQRAAEYLTEKALDLHQQRTQLLLPDLG